MPLSEEEFADKDDNALFRSIKVKDWDKVRDLISKSTQQQENMTRTDNASSIANDAPLLRQLDVHENSALHAAIGYQAPDDIVLALINAYPEATAIHGANEWLPLHVAAMWGSSPSIMTALIQQHPEGLDDRGEGGIKGRTPRHFKDRFPHNKELLERSTAEWRAEAKST
ncbi:expressed unknown protein [Seminavis robusta]|uniref:Ankyrin repeat protein n=1 Tax=Seminavis robusta TaxID=568900 RepID=A0A9N8DJY6_9STRA|nr:expressed unknown protein [Seminavis robusta]|eukprot:Sro100_g051150.1 n/a (170) ;mRNA; r:27073-27582